MVQYFPLGIPCTSIASCFTTKSKIHCIQSTYHISSLTLRFRLTFHPYSSACRSTRLPASVDCADSADALSDSYFRYHAILSVITIWGGFMESACIPLTPQALSFEFSKQFCYILGGWWPALLPTIQKCKLKVIVRDELRVSRKALMLWRHNCSQ